MRHVVTVTILCENEVAAKCVAQGFGEALYEAPSCLQVPGYPGLPSTDAQIVEVGAEPYEEEDGDGS